jgi:hypothetical protein
MSDLPEEESDLVLELLRTFDKMLGEQKAAASCFERWSAQWCYHQGQVDLLDALSESLSASALKWNL